MSFGKHFLAMEILRKKKILVSSTPSKVSPLGGEHFMSVKSVFALFIVFPSERSICRIHS